MIFLDEDCCNTCDGSFSADEGGLLDGKEDRVFSPLVRSSFAPSLCNVVPNNSALMVANIDHQLVVDPVLDSLFCFGGVKDHSARSIEALENDVYFDSPLPHSHVSTSLPSNSAGGDSGTYQNFVEDVSIKYRKKFKGFFLFWLQSKDYAF